MSLRVGDSGGFRDQPQYISLGGDVLRREVARCGFLQGSPSPGSLASGTADDSTYLRGDGTWAHIEAVRFPVKNNSGGTLAIGTPVYISGYVGASGRAEVSAARADTAANMPAIGLLEEELLNNGEGYATSFGVVKNLNTAGYGVNGVVYVAAAGGLTTTRPTAAGHLVQNIGRVLRDHASTGEILVMGPGRTNAVPNYTASRLLGRGAGSGDGDAQEITLGTNLSFSGTTLNATGGTGGGLITNGDYTMAATNLLGRTTNGTGAVEYLGVGKGLEFVTGGIRVKPLDVGTTELTDTSVTYGKIQNVSATDKILGRQSAGSGSVEEIACTAAGRAIIDDADAAAQRTTLGLGTLATQSGTFSGTSSGTNTGDQTITLTGDVTGSGTGSFAATIASGAVDTSKLGGDITTAGKALLDDADAAAQRTTLGLATIASSASATDLTTGTVATARLGTGTANNTTFLRGDQTWATPAGGSNEVKFANAGMAATSVASTTLVDLASKTVTVTAGDTIEIEIIGTILNNSGATRTYTFEAELGAFGVTCLDGTTVAANATNRAPIKIRAVYSVASTSSAGVVVFAERAAPGAADTGLSIATTTYRHAWHTSASNLTGSQAIKLRCLSSAATATQTFHVHSFIVRQYAQAL